MHLTDSFLAAWLPTVLTSRTRRSLAARWLRDVVGMEPQAIADLFGVKRKTVYEGIADPFGWRHYDRKRRKCPTCRECGGKTGDPDSERCVRCVRAAGRGLDVVGQLARHHPRTTCRRHPDRPKAEGRHVCAECAARLDPIRDAFQRRERNLHDHYARGGRVTLHAVSDLADAGVIEGNTRARRAALQLAA